MSDKKITVLAYSFLSIDFFSSVIEKIHNGKEVVGYVDHEKNLSKLDSAAVKINVSNLHCPNSIKRSFPNLESYELTSNILDELSHCHEYFMRSIDRISIRAKSYRYHQNFYHELLRYWLAFFAKHRNIKILLMTGSPHFPWEYVMYYAARYFNVKVLYPAKTALQSFVMIQSDIEGFGPMK